MHSSLHPTNIIYSALITCLLLYPFFHVIIHTSTLVSSIHIVGYPSSCLEYTIYFQQSVTSTIRKRHDFQWQLLGTASVSRLAIAARSQRPSQLSTITEEPVDPPMPSIQISDLAHSRGSSRASRVRQTKVADRSAHVKVQSARSTAGNLGMASQRGQPISNFGLGTFIFAPYTLPDANTATTNPDLVVQSKYVGAVIACRHLQLVMSRRSKTLTTLVLYRFTAFLLNRLSQVFGDHGVILKHCDDYESSLNVIPLRPHDLSDGVKIQSGVLDGRAGFAECTHMTIVVEHGFTKHGMGRLRETET